jgi:hypothetical protein
LVDKKIFLCYIQNMTKKWEPTDAEVAAIKAGGRITEGAEWDCARPDERALMRPDLNPHKRWFEQKAWKVKKQENDVFEELYGADEPLAI